MKFATRIKKLEKAVDEIRMQQGGLRCVFIEPGESEQECLMRHGLDKNFNGITVYIFKWAETGPDRPMSMQSPNLPKKGTVPQNPQDIDA